MSTTLETGVTNSKTHAKWLSLAILVFAQLGTMLDNSGFAVATEALITKLGATMPEIQFANAMYPLIAGAGMVVGGLTGLFLGWGRQLRLGAILLAISATIAAIAPNMDVLIFGGRVAAGLGAVFLVPAILAHVAGIYRGKDQAIAFAGIAGAVGVATAIVPIAMGAALDKFGFTASFFGVTGYFILVFLASFKLQAMPKAKFEGKFDVVGVVLSSVGLLATIVGLLKISEWGLIQPISDVSVFGMSPALPLVVFGVITLITLLKWEAKFEAQHGTALIPSTFIKNKQVLIGLYLCAIVFLMFGSLFINIAYVQVVGGASAAAAGLLMSIYAVGMLAGTVIAPSKMSNMTVRSVCLTGFAVSFVGLLIATAGITETGISILHYIGLAIFGFGVGILMTQASLTVTTALEQRDAEQSGGIQATSRNVGQAFGVAVLGSVLMFSLTGNIKSDVKQHDGLTEETKTAVLAIPALPFTSSQDFQLIVSDLTEDAKEQAIIHEINVQARHSSAIDTMIALLMIVASGLVICRGLPRVSIMQNKK
ncbi:MFS transporter [Vibrio alfacsensis]|uniref:MFS transporter n=1 Tax=Vibrio alfacsensis TaxID=1074311 RepID=UPI002ADD77FB|nr:MFS transporter [Vibrio alfacsensis]WQE75093.1 MFS transporter [Vibrio alfacsensis]